MSSSRFVFLDYLRAIAAWAVVYDHVLAHWPERFGATLSVVGALRAHIYVPLGVIQDFGWLGVCIFFLISGFIITHVSQREAVAEFLIRRFFRIFPLLSFFVLLSFVIDPDFRGKVAIGDLLRNMTLLNYFTVPQVVLVGVAWTLAIEILFYLATAATMIVRSPVLIVGANLVFCSLVIASCRNFGDNYFLFAASLAYVPYLVVGQIFYFAFYQNSISLKTALICTLAAFAVITFGISTIHVQFRPVENSYVINFLYACAIFSAFFLAEARLRVHRSVAFLSTTSYAVYLTHGVVGWAIFVRLWPYGSGVAIAATLVTTIVVSTLVHYAIERPTLEWGRRAVRLLRRGRSSLAPTG
jgi:peptidoglycan/LPS O-acetylase OafA/YrhL